MPPALIHNLAEVGCDYVERARQRVPMLNNVIEVAELYLDAAFSAMAPERPSDMRMCAQPVQECKLQRVSATVNLLQLSQVSQDRGILHRARTMGTRLLMRGEAFADHLAASGASGDEGIGLGSLRRCHSDCSFSSSCSASLISSTEDCDSMASEQCLTTIEMIPRAIVLPMVLQVQVARLVVDKASSFASMTTAMGCSLLQRGIIRCAQRGVALCRRCHCVALCHRAACLVDGFLAPGVRQVIILALTDDEDSKQSGAVQHSWSEGGTGCCTH